MRILVHVEKICYGDEIQNTDCLSRINSHDCQAKLAPAVGFEPTTNRLTADRSTTELRWMNSNPLYTPFYPCILTLSKLYPNAHASNLIPKGARRRESIPLFERHLLREIHSGRH